MVLHRLIKIKGSFGSKRLPLLFECLLCKDKFTVDDIRQKKFYAQTCICRKCYLVGVETNPRIWCFGKLQKINSPGYSEESVSCSLLCPDSFLCRKIVNKLTKEKE
jgi:hypothetical protein